MVLRDQVRSAFKANAHLTDPAQITEAKDAAARGLSNFMFFEAARMAQEEAAAKGLDPSGAHSSMPFK